MLPARYDDDDENATVNTHEKFDLIKISMKADRHTITRASEKFCNTLIHDHLWNVYHMIKPVQNLVDNCCGY